MSIFSWFSRRVGGLSMFVLIALSYWVISREASSQSLGHASSDELDPSSSAYATRLGLAFFPKSGGGIWTYVFAYYSLLVHGLMFMFPVRSCWAVWDITRSLKRAALKCQTGNSEKMDPSRRSSVASFSSSETLASDGFVSSSVCSEENMDLEQNLDRAAAACEAVIHAIIIPNYKEELDTLQETLEVLASHSLAQTSYDVYLAMEQREPNSESKALGLIQEFSKKFRSMDYTLHPSNIRGEAAGKGSNMGWAARKLSANYPMDFRGRVVITSIDSDSHLSGNYFVSLADMHLSYPETATTTLYAAPIIFDRNANNVPAIVRTADIMWAAAGMSGLYRSSVISPPTSVYSLPLRLADRVGGWDCDADAIGEDLHMYLKCFFALNGNLTCRTIMSPVSQSNITANRGQSLWGVVSDILARYKQALRHMWGALDTGFALRKGAELWRERKHTTRAFRPLHRTQIGDGSDIYFPENQVTGGDVDGAQESGVFADVTQETIKAPHWEKIFYLYHRLYEAHFLPVHMAILVVASTLFVWVMDSKGDAHGIAWSFTLSAVLRTAGFIIASCYLILYEWFHRVAVDARQEEMVEAGLANGMSFSRRFLRKNFVDFLLVPLVAPLYGSIPAAQALVAHLWTRDLVYAVSQKERRQRAQPVIAGEMV